MRLMGEMLLAVLVLSCAHAIESERLDLGGGVTLESVRIPAGSFEMGSPADESGRGPDEELHHVEIAETFLLARSPVTRGQFARFVQETGYRTEAEVGTSGGFGFDGTALVQRREFNWRNPGFTQADDHPVVLVTYGDALAFTRWLANKSGRTVSLPTEAQWEYACRAGTKTRYYSGDSDEDAAHIAWYKANSGKGTRPVAGREANTFGLYDMCGNVYQWCLDSYAPYVKGGGVQGPMDKPRRVLRGGSWLKDARHVRSAARARNAPGSRNADNGFRFVIGPAAAAPPVTQQTPATPTVTSVSKAPPAPVAHVIPQGTPAPPPPPASSPPAASSIPPPVPAVMAHSGGLSIPVVLLIFVLLGLSAGWIAWLLGRNPDARPTEQRRTLTNTAPRIVDDGFWFDTTGYHAGDVATYSYTGSKGRVSEDFVIEPSPSGQFIYTGARPSNIMLVNIIAAEMARHSQTAPPPPLPHGQTMPLQRTIVTHDDNNIFRGNPPAY